MTRLMKKAEFIGFLYGTGVFENVAVYPGATIDEALKIAFEKLGPNPTITLMPMGAITVPLNAKPTK